MVVRRQDLLRIQRELPDSLPRFVIAVFRFVDNRDPVPSLVAGGEGVTFFERRGLERSGRELSARKASRVHRELSIPIVRKCQLELRVVGDDAVNVAMGNRRREVLIGVDRGFDCLPEASR